MDGETRLMRDDSFPWRNGEGYVEICMNNQWKAVCDDGWDMNAARVVCREHGMLTEGRYIANMILVLAYHPPYKGHTSRSQRSLTSVFLTSEERTTSP